MILLPQIEPTIYKYYIDLGMSGLLIQALIAGGIGGLVLFRKILWKKIKGILRWKRK